MKNSIKNSIKCAVIICLQSFHYHQNCIFKTLISDVLFCDSDFLKFVKYFRCTLPSFPRFMYHKNLINKLQLQFIGNDDLMHCQRALVISVLFISNN